MIHEIKMNEIYCMDNLELLKKMKSNSVDLIYCDILYNTGKKFKDYDDRLGTPQQAMEWYRPRLIEMKRVLKETGLILLQMDYRLHPYVRIEMDNIYGIDNLVNDLIWQYSGGGVPKNKFAPKHDNILLYSKGNSYTFNVDILRVSYSESTKKRFKGTINNKRNGIDFGQQELNKLGKHPESVISMPILAPSSNERVGYETQKPKHLLEYLIKGLSNEGDIIADFFCGSGTSLVVAKELNRKYIGCDINPRAIEITNKRLNDIKIGG